MSTVSLMQAKLHRAPVTECNLDYVGSLSIDKNWMDEIGILPLEEVHVANVNQGTRFVTYAIPAPRGSETIGPNGACAHLCAEGDLLIIFTLTNRDRAEVLASGHSAKVLVFGDDGKIESLIEDVLVPADGGIVELREDISPFQS